MKKNFIIPIALAIGALASCKNNEAPKSLSVVAKGVNEGITLKWDKDDNAKSYVIYNGDSVIDEVSLNFTTVSFLNNDSTYHLGVAAKDKNGNIGNVSYVTAQPDANNEYDPMINDLNSNLETMIGMSYVNKMLDAGNINDNKSNTYRYKRVINNMRNGTKQTIAYIGGSITVGETADKYDDRGHQKGYARYSYEWLRSHYDKNKNSEFINASISGTDSCIASVRLEKDVLVHNPDLVFIEFAANNGTSEYDKKSYESLIRRVLNQPNEPAVILLYSSHTYTYSHQEGYMRPVGEYYEVPRFSMINAMIKGCRAKNDGSDLTPSTNRFYKLFTDDGTHPNNQGHQLYAKALVYTLKKLDEKVAEDSYTVKTQAASAPCTNKGDGDAYDNLKYVNNEENNSIITSTGSFVASDTSHRVLRDTADVVAYQKGWKKTVTNSNEALKITVTAKSFFIIYMAGNAGIAGDPKGNMITSYQNQSSTSDKGSLQWNVQRTCKQGTINQVIDNGNGWDNPCCIILFDKTSAATYNIEIKMDANSSLGTLLAFGYCE